MFIIKIWREWGARTFLNNLSFYGIGKKDNKIVVTE